MDVVCGGGDDVREVEGVEVGVADDGLVVDVADDGLRIALVRVVDLRLFCVGLKLTRIKKITEMKKKTQETMIEIFRVLVASLTSTPGVYVGVKVRSEFCSGPVAGPSATPFSCTDFSFCLRAASDRKVGRAMLD